jgi:predicted TPR repeat methyltransferase
MALFKRLYYYFFALRHHAFSAVACPQCATVSTTPFLTMDRYLLPVHFAMCAQCGLVHTSRNFSGDALYDFYQNDYRRFYENVMHIDNAYLFTHKPKLIAAYRMARIREVVGPFSSALEIGSGLGFFLDECRMAGVRHIRGLELGDHFRSYAQHTLGLGNAISNARFETIETLEHTPDLVTIFHVFEHLEDPAGCLRWIARHMAPHGTLVIEVPDITGDWARLGLGQFHTAHRWYFSPITLCNMLAANGFTPHFITREDGDGIYPGNLRVYAHVKAAGAAYPLPADDRARMLVLLNTRLRFSDKLRAARRLCMQAVRSRW